MYKFKYIKLLVFIVLLNTIIFCSIGLLANSSNSKMKSYNVQVSNCLIDPNNKKESERNGEDNILYNLASRIEEWFKEIKYSFSDKDEKYYDFRANRLIRRHVKVWGIDYESLAENLLSIDDAKLGAEVFIKLRKKDNENRKKKYISILPISRMIDKMVQANTKFMASIKKTLETTLENTKDKRIKIASEELVRTIDYYFSIL